MDNIFLRCISSAKSISAHFFLLNHQGPLYQQTHYTFAVKRSLNKFQNKLISIFPLVTDKKNLSTLTPILSNVFARRSISVLDRHFTCQCFEKTERVARHYKKIKRNKTSKISLEFDRNWTLQIIFFKMKIHKILCRNSIISHLIIKVDPKYWSYMPISTPKNEF